MASNTYVTIATLPTVNSAATTDRLLILSGAATPSANGRTITVSNVLSNTPGLAFVGEVRLSHPPVPPTSNSPGSPGELRFDNEYGYICVADSVWKRFPTSTW